ncbi:hypothetical protein Pelo_5946 [Pelomyxa schiedti]|nr:hypothetical protein Pelo_5946 [Pelomyxa schiedti]
MHWQRDVRTDLMKLQSDYNLSFLVTLMTSREMDTCHIPHLFTTAAELHIETAHYPIPDGGIPAEDDASTSEFLALVVRLTKAVLSGRTVIVHCLGGLGRSGTMCCCVLIMLNRFLFLSSGNITTTPTTATANAIAETATGNAIATPETATASAHTNSDGRREVPLSSVIASVQTARPGAIKRKHQMDFVGRFYNKASLLTEDRVRQLMS